MQKRQLMEKCDGVAEGQPHFERVQNSFRAILVAPDFAELA